MVIRYGVIGTGMMGREHIANVSRLSGAVVTALADPHPSRWTPLRPWSPEPVDSSTTAICWRPKSAMQ